MSKLNDYLWFEMNMYDIQKENISNLSYVVILNEKVIGFTNSYLDAIKTFGDDISVFYVASNYPRGIV